MIFFKRKLSIGIALMFFSSICACLGQLLWKLASEDINMYLLFCGFVLYGAGALMMIIAYRFGSLSVLQPVLALNYVLSIFLGALVLHEQITFFKCLGIIFIMAGVFCIATGEKK